MAGTLLLVSCAGMVCGPFDHELEPQTFDDECAGFACPLALDGELLVLGIEQTDVTLVVPVTDAAATPAGVVEVRPEGRGLNLRGLAKGEARLRARVDGREVEVPVAVAARASTTVAPRFLLPDGLYDDRDWPGGGLAVYTDSWTLLLAEHRTADGARLLGHGFEDWALVGVSAELEAPADSLTGDPALARWLRAGPAATAVEIRAGGTELALDIVAPGAATTLALLHDGRRIDAGDTLDLVAGLTASLHALAFTASGRYIVGGIDGQLTARATGAATGDVDVRMPERTFRLRVEETGTGELTITLDGRVARFPLVVR